MKAENLYHTGMVVDDLEATMEWLTEVAGYTGPTSSPSTSTR